MVMVLTSTLTIMAQITTSALSGKVTTQDTKEEVIGATVQGPKTTYGSTVELIDVSVVNIKKSIVKVDSLSIDTLPKAGGEAGSLSSLSTPRTELLPLCSRLMPTRVVHSISNLRNNQTIQVIYQGELLSGFPFFIYPPIGSLIKK